MHAWEGEASEVKATSEFSDGNSEQRKFESKITRKVTNHVDEVKSR